MKKLALSALLLVAAAASFADSATSKSTSVTLNIADFMEITTPGDGLDALVVNVSGDPTLGAEEGYFWSNKAAFTVRSNRTYTVAITSANDPSAGTWDYLFGGVGSELNGLTYLQGLSASADSGDTYSLQARVQNLKLSDGTDTRTGSVTISLAVPN